jgi:hypothetical protein
VYTTNEAMGATMIETTFAEKMEAADRFRAKINSTISAEMTRNPAGAATLRKMATSLKAINDARMYRIAVTNGGTDMVLKPLKVVLAAIARGDKTAFRDMKHLLDHVGAAAMTLAHHRATEKEMAELLMADRALGPRLIRVF